MLIKNYFALFSLLLLNTVVFAQSKFTLSGTIRDAGTGETLIGATIKVIGPATGATLTNAYGYFALTQVEGEYTVSVSYTGYAPIVKKINLTKDTKLNEELKSANDLADVTVSATNRKNENVKSAQMGLERVDMKALNSIPVLLGEKDILKTIQLLPGVKSGG
ncbi:hypothetical protein D3C85_941790 [compost metagenome]